MITLQLVQRQMKPELMFIVDEELITVMDSIVEEHECKNKACSVVTESSYSGIELHERPCSSTERVFGSPKLKKDIERSMECGVRTRKDS